MTRVSQEELAVTVWLAFPPSVNNLFATRGNVRVPTPKYRDWRDAARLDILAQQPAHVSGPFEVDFLLERPDRRKRDLDNYAKAPIDSLVSAGVLDEDHLSRRILLEWAGDEPVKGARVHISIRSAA